MKQFIKQNPIPAAVIAVALLVALYLVCSAIWDNGHIMLLEHQNSNLQKDIDSLTADRKQLVNAVAKREDIIVEKDKEIEKSNALLETISKKTVSSKQNMDEATRIASGIINDQSPMSREQLKAALCKLYPNDIPEGCK